MLVDSTVKNNRLLFYGAVAQLLYAIIEFVDSLSIPLISLGILPNWYATMPLANEELSQLLANEPLWFIPIFWFFTAFRWASSYWILKNKAKGFWLAMFISIVTLVAAFFLLPFSVIDIIGTGIVVFLLVAGYFGETPLLNEVDE
jgi:hypothetical protein